MRAVELALCVISFHSVHHLTCHPRKTSTMKLKTVSDIETIQIEQKSNKRTLTISNSKC